MQSVRLLHQRKKKITATSPNTKNSRIDLTFSCSTEQQKLKHTECLAFCLKIAETIKEMFKPF